MKKIYAIDDDFIEMRLDKWIKKNISDIPQSLIEKNIRKGNIKVNNKKEKSSYKLKKNDQVILHNFSFLSQKHKKITTQVLVFGCSFKKIELKIADIKGPKLIITRVLATFVFSKDIMKVILPKSKRIAFITPANPISKQTSKNFLL